MPQNQLSGPQIGQIVWWTGTPGTPVIPAIVTAVANGVPDLTTIAAGVLTSRPAAVFDPNAVTANSWRWPDDVAGI
jgi:hypothetical protein